MNKFGIGIIIFTFLILSAGAYFFTKPEKQVEIPQKEANTYEYFWGNGCPHCKVVADFFNSSDKDEKVNLVKYEVWYDQNNTKIMEDRYNKCDPKPTGAMAVPFMVTPDGKCLVGDAPIIELFNNL